MKYIATSLLAICVFSCQEINSAKKKNAQPKKTEQKTGHKSKKQDKTKITRGPQQQLERSTVVSVLHPSSIKTINDLWNLLDAIHAIGKTDEVKAVLIRADPIGLDYSMSYHLHAELINLNKIKPVVALVTGDCTSSCYHIISGVDRIIASPISTIGSIGVYESLEKHRNPKLERNGFSADMDIVVLYHGKYKTTSHPYVALTDEQKDHYQQLIDDQYEELCTEIATARNLDKAKHDEWADGRLLTGEKAKSVGLIDDLGSLTTARNVIKDVLKKRGTEVEGELIFVDVSIKKSQEAEEEEEEENANLSKPEDGKVV